jgi:hypothetical protein
MKQPVSSEYRQLYEKIELHLRRQLLSLALPIYVLQLKYEQDHLFALIQEIDVPAMGRQLITEG